MFLFLLLCSSSLILSFRHILFLFLKCLLASHLRLADYPSLFHLDPVTNDSQGNASNVYLDMPVHISAGTSIFTVFSVSYFTRIEWCPEWWLVNWRGNIQTKHLLNTNQKCACFRQRCRYWALPKQQSDVRYFPCTVHPNMETELIYKILWSLY
jgi:hypothetical protein